MDLVEQMITFQRVVDTGSLSAAARARRLSLAAVSRQLAALEAELGARLLLRTTRKLQLTDAGRRWYERSARLLADLEEARAAVVGDGEVAGPLVVSAPVTFGAAHVVPRVPGLLRRHRRLALELRLEDRFVDLVGEGLDVAVRVGLPPDTGDVVAQPLLVFHRIAVAAPAYLARRGTPRRPTELARHDCLVQLGPAARPSWTFGDTSVEPRGCLRTNSPAALRSAALAALGIALLPEWLVGDDLASGALRRVLEGCATPEITAWAIYRVELRGAPRIRALVDALRGG